MCGFTGYVALKNHINSERLIASLQSIAHRGPDDEGVEIYDLDDYELCLAHKRLSIIDLSVNGHQPFIDLTGQFAIIYNGEVYNYRELRDELIALGHIFRTDSDTEVVLEAWKAWGNDSWKKCIGMFSLIIYDKQNQELILVRDAFGIKPLYYSQSHLGFFFGSEISAIKTLYPNKMSMNKHRTFSYLIWGHYDYGDQTFFSEINQIKPGHSLCFDLKTREVKSTIRWWWPSIRENKNITFDEATTVLRDLFKESIRLHLRSDVSLGVALSGGVDSSAVTCTLKKVSPESKIKTFSFIATDSEFNEEKWVDKVNTFTNAEVFKVYLEAEDMVNDLEDLIATLEEPFISTSVYAQYRVFKLVKESGVTVSLDGQGADELLAGYQGYPNDRLRSMLQKREWVTALKFLNSWGKWPGRSRKQAIGILFQELIPENLKYQIKLKKNPLFQLFFDDNQIPFSPISLVRSVDLNTEESKGRQLANALRSDLMNGGLQSLLRHGDRNSMRWSVESRVPFLTIPLIEFVLSLPENYLISNDGETKSVFKAAMRGIVPDEILDRKDKIGFNTPEADWLIKMDPNQWINRDLIKSFSFFKSETLISHLEDQFSGKKPWHSQSWRILNFLKWYELNFKN